PAASPIRLAVSSPTGIDVAGGDADPDVALSADGRRIVLVGSAGEGKPPRLFVRTLDDLEAHPLTGPTIPRAPFFSPDGNWIGFFDSDPNGLKKVAGNGGPAVPLCGITGAPGASGGGPRGATWSPDNSIVF